MPTALHFNATTHESRGAAPQLTIVSGEVAKSLQWAAAPTVG